MTPTNPYRLCGSLLRLRIGPGDCLLFVRKIAPESGWLSIDAAAGLMMRAARRVDRNVVMGTNAWVVATDSPRRVLVVGRLQINVHRVIHCRPPFPLNDPRSANWHEHGSTKPMLSRSDDGVNNCGAVS